MSRIRLKCLEEGRGGGSVRDGGNSEKGLK